MGPMDTTPATDRVSEIADADPAEAVKPAEALADELEASLVDDAAGAETEDESPDEGEQAEPPPA